MGINADSNFFGNHLLNYLLDYSILCIQCCSKVNFSIISLLIFKGRLCHGNLFYLFAWETSAVHQWLKLNLTQQWIADSAATCGYHVGGSPDDRTMKVLSKHGIKQYEHTVRIVTDEDFREFDYILGMDDNNIRDLECMKSKVNNAKCKIQLLGSYDPENNSRIIPDPYYTNGLSNFEELLLYIILSFHFPNNIPRLRMEKIVMYIVVRSDLAKRLNWTSGAVIAQACHATSAVLWKFRDDPLVSQYMQVIGNQVKVVLEVNIYCIFVLSKYTEMSTDNEEDSGALVDDPRFRNQTTAEIITEIFLQFTDEYNWSDGISDLEIMAKAFEDTFRRYVQSDPDPLECLDEETFFRLFNCNSFFKGFYPKLWVKLLHQYMHNTDHVVIYIVGRILAAMSMYIPVEAVIRDFFLNEPQAVEILCSRALMRNSPVQMHALNILVGMIEIVKSVEPYSSWKTKNMEVMHVILPQLWTLANRTVTRNVGTSSRADGEIQHTNKRSRVPSDDASNSATSSKQIRLNSELNSPTEGDAEVMPLYLMFKNLPDDNSMILIILRYIGATGVYCEVANQHRILDLLFHFLKLENTGSDLIVFQAAQCIGILFEHPRLMLEFVQRGGVTLFTSVSTSSVAACSVARTLTHLSAEKEPMDKISNLGTDAILALVTFMIELLENFHESARYYGAMFLGAALKYRVVLKIFDSIGGLRSLLNGLASVYNRHPTSLNPFLTSLESQYSWRFTARSVIQTLSIYFESHVYFYAEDLGLQQRSKRHLFISQASSSSSAAALNNNAPVCSQVMIANQEVLEKCVRFLSTALAQSPSWHVIEQFRQLDGLRCVLRLTENVSHSPPGIHSRGEIVFYSLRVCHFVSVHPAIQLDLLKMLPQNWFSSKKTGFQIIIPICEEMKNSPSSHEVLNIMVNCVCGPLDKYKCLPNNEKLGFGNDAMTVCTSEELLKMIWKAVRQENVIMPLLDFIYKSVSSEVEEKGGRIALMALNGLCRDESIKQMLMQLPLIAENELLDLVKESSVPQKRKQGQLFRKQVQKFLKQVVGVEVVTNEGFSNDQLYKEKVTNDMVIQYDQREIHLLIFRKLCEDGMFETAKKLYDEAGLSIYNDLLFKQPQNARDVHDRMYSQSNEMALEKHAVARSEGGNRVWAVRPVTSIASSFSGSLDFTPKSSNNFRRSNRFPFPAFYSESSIKTTSSNNRLQNLTFPSNMVSLDNVMNDYFRSQHRACPKPIAGCMEFSVFDKHRCPEPKPPVSVPTNLAARFFNRPYFRFRGIVDSYDEDWKFIYSRLRLDHFALSGANLHPSFCTAFSPDGSALYYGTINGIVHAMNMNNRTMMPHHYAYHDSLPPVANIAFSELNPFMLVSHPGTHGFCLLWSLNDSSNPKHMFDDKYAEFSHVNEDRMLGTKSLQANVYDVETGLRVVKLFKTSLANRYERNRAHFHPQADIVLSDGILWDPRTTDVIHKFDKLNPRVAGEFHPNGSEVIINSEVWDMRTYRLMKSISELDNKKLTFNKTGEVIFAVLEEYDEEVSSSRADNCESLLYDRYISVYNARDYSLIHRFDIKRYVVHVAVNPFDTYLSVITSIFSSDGFDIDKNTCELYQVGRKTTSNLQDSMDNEFLIEQEEDDEDYQKTYENNAAWLTRNGSQQNLTNEELLSDGESSTSSYRSENSRHVNRSSGSDQSASSEEEYSGSEEGTLR
ncbi:Protein VPRBP [Trichinella papuae]|uniref:Protein VPRBP n=1 Tax=Trichinella papuae TaxID=268474 RepID=A0A0V1MFP9_9BILA|nr:Protein VPRBP [Trichinella papuae]